MLPQKMCLCFVIALLSSTPGAAAEFSPNPASTMPRLVRKRLPPLHLRLLPAPAPAPARRAEVETLHRNSATAAATYVHLQAKIREERQARIDYHLWLEQSEGRSLSPFILQQIETSRIRHESLVATVHTLSQVLDHHQSAFDNLHSDLNHRLKTQPSLSDDQKALGLRVALAKFTSEFRLGLAHLEGPGYVPVSPVNQEAFPICSESLVENHLLWELLKAELAGAADEVGALSFELHMHLSCLSIHDLKQYAIALDFASRVMEEEWKWQPEIVEAAFEHLVQPLFLFFDKSASLGQRGLLEWFGAKAPILHQRLQHVDGPMRRWGLFMSDRHVTTLRRLPFGCPATNAVGEVDYLDQDVPGCGGLADFITSIGDSRAWGIGDCMGSDMVRQGSLSSRVGLTNGVPGNASVTLPASLVGQPPFFCGCGVEAPEDAESPTDLTPSNDVAVEPPPGADGFPWSERGEFPTENPLGSPQDSFMALCQAGGLGNGQSNPGAPGAMGMMCGLGSDRVGPHLGYEFTCLQNSVTASRDQSQVGIISPNCSLSQGGENDSSAAETESSLYIDESDDSDDSDEAPPSAQEVQATAAMLTQGVHALANDSAKQKEIARKVEKGLEASNIKDGRGNAIKVTKKDLKGASAGLEAANTNARLSKDEGEGAGAGYTWTEGATMTTTIKLDPTRIQDASQKDADILVEHEFAHAVQQQALIRTRTETDASIKYNGQPNLFLSPAIGDILHTAIGVGGLPKAYDNGSPLWDCMDEMSCSSSCTRGDLAAANCYADAAIEATEEHYGPLPGGGHTDPSPDSDVDGNLEFPEADCFPNSTLSAGNNPCGLMRCLNGVPFYQNGGCSCHSGFAGGVEILEPAEVRKKETAPFILCPPELPEPCDPRYISMGSFEFISREERPHP